MKAIYTTSLLLTLILGMVKTNYAQTTLTGSGKYASLLGEWISDSEGKPGEGSGTFSFTPDLDNRVIIRKNHVSFAATPAKAAFNHDDILMIYAEQPGQPDNAIYIDNEDHVIHYKSTIQDNGKTIVFQSEAKGSMPVFKLLYTLTDIDHVTVTFQMAQPNSPNDFHTYIAGKAHRKK